MRYNPPLVLASNSPRRREILALGGWPFEIKTTEIDERPLDGEGPRDYVLRMAEGKARAVTSRVMKESVVIGADTTVVIGDRIMGKPVDNNDAWVMLRRLRGTVHQVYTAIVALRMTDNLLLTDVCVTDVPMRDYTDTEIEAYIATGDPFDKAGAYAIQHKEFNPAEALSGCFANVMGLPLCHLVRTLDKLGIPAQPDIPKRCQKTLHYLCPIYEQVLAGEY